MSPSPIPTRTLTRTDYRAIPLYGGEPSSPVELDLSDNTNQWGVPPAAAAALAAVDPAVAARYPSPYAPELSRALARYAGVDPDMVVTGCGSDQLLDCTFRALAEPGGVVAHADPTFVIVPSFARANSLVPKSIPWIASGTPDVPSLELDATAMLAAGARITYLCSPNNPTGTVIDRGVIERIVRQAPGVVIVDEAYVEFGEWSAAALLPAAPNLLVTRTFSKAFGLAGLRIGYALGDRALVREIAKARGPYALSAYAEPAALAALRNDLDWVRAHVREAVVVRDRLAAALAESGAWRVYPSGANFLLAAPDESLPPAAEIGRSLREAGIAVRAFSDLPVIGGALRITVAPWPQMERLLAALPAPGDAR